MFVNIKNMNLFIVILHSVLLWVTADMAKEAELENYQPCLDHKGKEVSHGDRFFPLGSDPCTQCTCLNGKPQMCIAVFCSPPENCRQYHALSDKCCEFVCLDRDFPNKASGNGTYPGKDDTDALSTTNLGLRLVASTVTSFLILALLLFMIHRLRQRRLLLMIRRFHARRMDNGNAHLSRRFSEDDDGSVGYFVGHDQLDFSRYDEPPPPYTLWKPPEMYIPPGEAPPPYDLSVQLTAPYSSSARYNYAPTETVDVTQQQAIIHAENQEESPQNVDTIDVSAANSNMITVETFPGTNCSLCTAADIEMNNAVNSSDRAVLPPDIQYEESCSYGLTNGVSCSTQPEITVINSDDREEDLVNANVACTSSSCDDNAVATTSSCTCTLTSKKGKTYKRHSCNDYDQNRPRKAGQDKNGLHPSGNQENNNLYPDPTAWNGEASESSSSSSPTYDQPTLSPSTSDSSSADADFPRVSRIEQLPAAAACCTIPSRTSSREISFDNVRNRDFADDVSKPPNFQKTLSNLKKFSLIKRKKKKRRMEKLNEISCSFVCQSMSDNLHSTHQLVFEESVDLVSRNSAENISRPLEAINPHIGHKLASSGLRAQIRPTSINIPGQSYRQHLRGSDGAGPSYLSYGDGACCSVVTVSGSNVKDNCSVCCNASSPDSICEDHRPQAEVHIIQSSRSLNRQGISRSGSICSETGERRHHRSAGSSPTTLPRSNHSSDCCNRYSESRCASSSHILVNDRTMGNRNSFQGQDYVDGNVRHIPVWIVNSVAIASRHEYDTPNVHSASIRRSASGSFGENSRSVGDISSPLDFRDSMLSSGSSWEACSHL